MDADPLWRVDVAGGERWPVGSRYHWQNLRRQPMEQVCLQAVDAGGVMLRRSDGGEELVTAGHAFLFRHGEPSSYWMPPDARAAYITRWVTLRGAGLAEHWDAIRARAGWAVPLTPELDAHLRHLHAIAPPASVPSHQAATAVHALVMHLIQVGAELRAAASDPIDRAIAAIRDDPFRPWSVKRVAEEHGLSREHLTRVFIQRLGEAPAAWLAKRRLDRALELLHGTGMDLHAIARASGFGSTDALVRRVREATGKPPSVLRRRS